MATKYSENNNIVFLIDPQNHQSAGIDGDSFHIGRISEFCILVTFGELTNDSIMSVYSGATAGTKTTQEAFRYRVSDAELKMATGDTFGPWVDIAAGAGLTLTAATYEDKMVIIEMGTDEFTDGQPWVTLEIDSTASEMFVSAVMLGRPRYFGHDVLTLID